MAQEITKKPTELKALVDFLNLRLCIEKFSGDESANGLQFQGKNSILNVGVAVDACEFVIKEATRRNMDFLFVHHGLIWGGLKSISGLLKKRLDILFKNNISLYACHLPLDAHEVLGNNAQLLKKLGLKKIGDFGYYHGSPIGCIGSTNKDIPVSHFVQMVNDLLKTSCKSVTFSKKVRNIGIVSGGGWFAIKEAEQRGIDTFLTGEPSHSSYTLAEELGINLIFAGHYATETLGVQAAGRELAKKFRLNVDFIDHPTGL